MQEKISLRGNNLIRQTSILERQKEFLATGEYINPLLVDVPTRVIHTPELQWTQSQRRKPRLQRVPNWRQRLLETFDRWSGFRYASGTRSCFIFACASVDAMCGTKAEATHFKGWDGVANFWGYLAPRGGREHFDKLGIRTHLSNVKTGDLVQFEVGNEIFSQFHWCIVSDDKGKAIGFTATGLEEIDLAEHRQAAQATRCWQIG